MLIEFRVENHRSLRDEQVLTMAEGRVRDEADDRPRKITGCDERLLPAAVLYGANASGKSNVLSALSFMREAVLLSHRLWEPDSGVPRAPFGWGPKKREPSTFEVAFVIDGVRHEYGFVVSDESVEEEWLYAWPIGRKQVWFERDQQSFSFGPSLKGPNDVMEQVTRPNALFLSVASQHKHLQLSTVYSWFRNMIPVNIQGRTNIWWRGPHSRAFWMEMGRPLQGLLFGDDDDDAGQLATNKVRELLKAADTGIVDVRIVEEVDETSDRKYRRERMRLKHQADDEGSWLDLEEESQGTKTLFSMAIPILRTLESGGILLVDELESSLHPLLGLTIVNMFNSSKSNRQNAQILFTTHDTNLLGTTLGEAPLRRDQIWFTEKDNSGATSLYPLTDYHPRKAENLERGYLQGRYGAIPYLGDMRFGTE